MKRYLETTEETEERSYHNLYNVDDCTEISRWDNGVTLHWGERSFLIGFKTKIEAEALVEWIKTGFVGFKEPRIYKL